MLKKKKAQGSIPVTKTIIMVLLTGILLILWAIIIFQAKNIEIDEKKIKTQLIISNIIDSQCLSKDLGIINIENLEKETISECIKGLDETTLVRITVKNKNENLFSETFETSNGEFRNKASLCNKQSTILCSEMNYPMIIKDQENNEETGILTLQIITT